MHVPFVARMPGVVPAGTPCADLIGFSDVLPTLAEFSGAELPDTTLDGVSFAPQLRGKAGTPRDSLFCWYTKGPYRGSIDKAKRFAWNEQWKLYTDGELYHVAEDHEEQQPIKRGEGGQEAEQARDNLRETLDSMPSRWQARN